MSRTFALVLGISFGVPAASAVAQVEPGTRVRVTENGQKRVVGRLVSIDETTLSVRPDGNAEPVAVSRSTLTRIDVSQRLGRKRRGATIGLLVGALAGAVALASATEDCSRNDFVCLFPREQQTTNTVLGAVVFGALGAGLGALVAPGEKWESIPSQRVRLSLAPTPGRGVAAQVTIRFGGRTR